MRYEKGSFLTVPNKEILRTVSVGARAVYMEICDFSDEYGKCFPSRKTIAKNILMHENSVDRFISELELVGVLEKSGRVRKDGSRTSNEYQILVAPLTTHSDTPLTTHSEAELNPYITKSTYTCESDDSPVEVVSESSLEKEPKQDTRRTKDKLEIYHLFSDKEQPWWRHAQQRKAALSLFDLIGTAKVRAGLAFCKANEDNPYCPQPMTPYEYEQALPGITRFRRKNDL